MLLEEKTFEAPLSLFVQLPESGHLVSSYQCFVVFVFASLKCLIIFDTATSWVNLHVYPSWEMIQFGEYFPTGLKTPTVDYNMF